MAKNSNSTRTKTTGARKNARATGMQSNAKAAGSSKKLTCFVIMPISDVPGYESGHFDRVYDFLIAPACELAGFTPLRADRVKETNDITVNVVRSLLEADMAVCDLSTKNANVFYELGVRHAFVKPVTLVKDLLTNRAFDVQGIRDVAYDERLRVDTVRPEIEAMATAIRSTYERFHTASDDINSPIQHLGISSAVPPESKEISLGSHMVLQAIDALGERINSIESAVYQSRMRDGRIHIGYGEPAGTRGNSGVPIIVGGNTPISAIYESASRGARIFSPSADSQVIGSEIQLNEDVMEELTRSRT